MKKIFNNPIIENQGVADPHMHVFDGKVYMYCGHDKGPGYDDYTMEEWRVFSSEDLINWKLECTFRPEESYIGPFDKCFAGDGAERNGKYYLYFSKFQESTGVAVSENGPGGPYRDALGKPLLPKEIADTACYDPTVFIDDDENKTPYIIFGYTVFGKSYYIARLNDDMISLAEEPRKIEIDDTWHNDATWMTKRGDTYYLNSHETCYATSKNIYGPYTRRKDFAKEAFGDHGTFFDYHNQNYFAFCLPENWGVEMKDVDRFYRTTKIAYAHYRANGDIVVDPFGYKVGVGQYDASWGKISSAWYFRATDELRKIEIKDGFGVTGIIDGSVLEYPNFSGIRENAELTLRVQANSGSSVTVYAGGEVVGKVYVEDTAGEFVEVSCPLTIAEGKYDLMLKFEGSMILDWLEVK